MSEGAAGDPIVGRVLSETYRVEARLGAGGMGAVYSARHVRTGRAYAVKVLLPEIAARRAAIARFRREAQALAAIGHAHIVGIHDHGETSDGLAFLVMDLLEGEDLAARLRRGPLPVGIALALADQIASALEAAHGIGLVHRDLKPANVFLARVAGAGERAVLLDFGLAKSLSREGVPSVTSAGVVMGTPHYMAPEQAQGGPLDPRTDLWALGVILHEMLCGRPPFDAPSMASLFVQILTAPPPLLRARGVAASDALEALIQRCLGKTPAERFADAGTFRRALHAMGPQEGAVGAHAAAVPATIAQPATPPIGSSAPQTRATPASPPHGQQPPTPIGNPFATPGTGAPAERSPGGRALWVGAGALVTIALLGSVAVIAVAVITTTQSRAPGAASDASTAPAAPSRDAGATTTLAATPAPDGGAAGAVDAGRPAIAEAPAGGTLPRAGRGARRGGDRAHPVAPAGPDPGAPAAPDPGAGADPRAGAGGGVPIPPGLDTSAPGMAERIAARPALSRGDWRGCLDALRGAPPTLDVLWDRASCAYQARDRAELERTCAALVRHHAGTPQVRACEGMLLAMP